MTLRPVQRSKPDARVRSSSSAESRWSSICTFTSSPSGTTSSWTPCRSETSTDTTSRRRRSTWARLGRICELVDVPLSLRGASGLPDEDVRRAVSLGISKVNVNAEIREAYLARLSEHLPEALGGLKLLDLKQAVIDAVAAVVRKKGDLLTV
jgi:hypothetical protein